MKKNYLQPATTHGFCRPFMSLCSGTTVSGEKPIEPESEEIPSMPGRRPL